MRRKGLPTVIAALVGLSIGAACGPAFAVRLVGTSTTAAYIQKVREPLSSDSFENSTRVFERVRFDVLDLGAPALAFHGHFTVSNDIANQSIGDARTRLYSGFLEYLPMRNGTRPLRAFARLGRQWVASGIGSGTMDGLAIQADHADWGGAIAFAGTLGIDRRDQFRFDDPDDSNRYGGEVRIHPRISETARPEVAVSYAIAHRNDRQESRRLGVRADLRVRRQLRLWSDVRHDFVLDRTYGTAAGAEFLKPSKKLRLWFESNRRTSALPGTNFFSMFDQKPISSLRGGIGFGVGGPYRLSLDFGRIDFKSQVLFAQTDSGRVSRSTVDRSSSFRLVLQRGWMQLGGRIMSGFGGKQAGLVASGSRQLGRLTLDIDLDYLSYDHGQNSLEDNDAASGILAASYQVAPATRLTAQIEALNNAGLRRDVRFLARVDQRFRLGR